MKTKIYLLLFTVAAFLFSSCNDYLDKSPDSGLDVDSRTPHRGISRSKLYPFP